MIERLHYFQCHLHVGPSVYELAVGTYNRFEPIFEPVYAEHLDE